MTQENEELTKRILEIEDGHTNSDLALSLCAAFCASVLGQGSIDRVRAHIIKHGFDNAQMLPFWEEIARGVREEFMEEFEELGEQRASCGDPDCLECGTPVA